MQQEAQAAKQHTQGYQLDKRHAFKVNMFDEFDKFLKIADSYEEPETKEYAPTENLQVSRACCHTKGKSALSAAVMERLCGVTYIICMERLS